MEEKKKSIMCVIREMEKDAKEIFPILSVIFFASKSLSSNALCHKDLSCHDDTSFYLTYSPDFCLYYIRFQQPCH